jgi:hypothetical protein
MTRVRSSSISVSIVTIPNLGQRKRSDCLINSFGVDDQGEELLYISVSIVTIPNLGQREKSDCLINYQFRWS